MADLPCLVGATVDRPPISDKDEKDLAPGTYLPGEVHCKGDFNHDVCLIALVTADAMIGVAANNDHYVPIMEPVPGPKDPTLFDVLDTHLEEPCVDTDVPNATTHVDPNPVANSVVSAIN